MEDGWAIDLCLVVNRKDEVALAYSIGLLGPMARFPVIKKFNEHLFRSARQFSSIICLGSSMMVRRRRRK